MKLFLQTTVAATFITFSIGCGNSDVEKNKVTNQEESRKAKFRQEISKVLKQANTIMLSSPERSLKEKYWDDSKYLFNLIDKLRSIDIAECPEDFCSGYLEWLRALSEYTNTMTKYKGINGMLNSTAALFHGKWSASEPNDAAKACLTIIGKKYDALDLLAIKYGATNALKKIQ